MPRFVGPRCGGRNKIAVIYGVGAIQRGAGGFDPMLSPGSTAMGSDDMVKAFKDAREDDSVRAVVFRVDSPGGSVIASELIRRAVELTAAKKPVVVSMSSYAASGGYWVSTPAAAIISRSRHDHRFDRRARRQVQHVGRGRRRSASTAARLLAAPMR